MRAHMQRPCASFHPDERDCCIVTMRGADLRDADLRFHPDERDCCIVTGAVGSLLGLTEAVGFHPDERDCCIVTTSPCGKTVFEANRFPSRRAGLLYCDL